MQEISGLKVPKMGAVYVGQCYPGRWQVLVDGGLADGTMFGRLCVLSDQYELLDKDTHGLTSTVLRCLYFIQHEFSIPKLVSDLL